MSSGVWTAVPTQTGVTGSGGIDFLTDSSARVARRFYRVGVQLP